MDIKEVDKNFDLSFEKPEDLEWFSVREEPFETYGIYYSKEEGLYRRLPKDIANATNEGVLELSTHTAGGRVRFETNSPYVVIKAKEEYTEPFSHMTICGKCGFALYVDNNFADSFMPTFEQYLQAAHQKGDISVDGLHERLEENPDVYSATLFFPLYSPVKEVYIGLKKGSILRKAKPYKHTTPVVFYGSSITQGACASKPGDDYINRLSRLLDTDIINLGFSGSARAEKVMVEYLTTLNPSVFVLDYDHNAPDAEFLEKTHYPLYEAVRKAHPDTPIILMTMPTIAEYEKIQWFNDRRVVIMNNYAKALDSGDKNVYLVDCFGCFGKFENGEAGTVDRCHPDSLGFLRMTEKMYPLLDKLLNK